MHSIRVGGIVLCGGQSRRMGRPKAWLPFRSETLLERVVRILREVTAPIVVVAAPDQVLPALPGGVAVARDEEKGRGPLQGLAGGLAALHGRADAAYVSSCDVPFLKPAFIAKIIELLGDAAICVPNIGERYHPLAAVYRLSVVNAVVELLSANRLRPVYLYETVPTRVVTASELISVDPEFASLCNLNSPQDYEAALAKHAEGLIPP
jgi:molybdopterin-guanine dinucleotide biosynthesis protein A